MTASLPISVVIPTFNDASHIGQALESVLTQTAKPTEIIVVDDGSADDTQETLAQFKGEITHVRITNRGVSAARNVGISRAVHSWIAFLDSDDLWLKDKLGLQCDLLMHAPPSVVLVYGQMQNVSLDGERLDVWPTLLCETPGDTRVVPYWAGLDFFPPTSTVVVRRAALLEAGLFDETLATAEDLDLWVRLRQRGEFVGLPRVLAYRRFRSGSLTHSNGQVDQYRRYLAVAKKRRGVIREWAGDLAGTGPSYIHTSIANVYNREQKRWQSLGHALLGSLRSHPERGLALRLLLEAVIGKRVYQVLASKCRGYTR